MVRLTLRQFRTEGIVSVALLVALGVLLALTGPHLAQVSDAYERACRAARDCATTQNPVIDVDTPLQGFLPFAVTVAPALIGLFFGAPLVARELEAGTFRLVWTQSVTRRRWVAVKLGVVGCAAMTVGGLLAWMADWWMSPLDAVDKDRFDPANFSVHGVVPIGYAAFAFVLGVTAGVLLRRTVPAIAATLVAFVVARLAVERWVRPNLAAPLHRSISLSGTGDFGILGISASTGSTSLAPPPVNVPNAWVLSTAVVDKSGRALTAQRLLHTCPGYGQAGANGPPSPAAVHSMHAACIARLASSFHTVVTYQPGSRFWPFQWGELALFLAAALACCGIVYWWIRRRYG